MKITTCLVLAVSILTLAPASGAYSVWFDDRANCVQVVEASVGAYYVSVDEAPVGAFSIWIYEEVNHVAGLQRGDEVCDDTNGGETESDLILF